MNEVGVAALKSRLSEFLRLVRSGREITVLDRDTPVARLVPARRSAPGIHVRPPLPGTGGPAGVALPDPLALDTDAVGLLLREREAGS